MQVIHGHKRSDESDGQSQNGNQGRTEVKKENDDHQTDDDRLFEQVALQCVAFETGGCEISGRPVETRTPDLYRVLGCRLDDQNGNLGLCRKACHTSQRYFNPWSTPFGTSHPHKTCQVEALR